MPRFNWADSFKMRDLRTIAKKESKGSEFVFESFTDPKTSRHGMWISAKGVHFDPAKLEPQTAA